MVMNVSNEHDDLESAAADEVRKEQQSDAGTGRRMLRVVVVIAIGLAIGFFFVHRQKAEAEAHLAEATAKSVSEAPAVDVVTIRPAAGAQSITLPGETAAWDATTIYARVNGYVAKWLVDIGDEAKAGQTLATIETPELDAELAAAKAKLNASISQVTVKQAQADFAETTDERWRDSPKGVVSDQERESKKAGSAVAFAELNAARAQVALQQADVDRLTALTQFKIVKAPFDGTIVERKIDIGNLVTAGSTASTSPMYEISKDDPIRIFVHAPQSAAASLMRGGVDAAITCNDLPGKIFEGRISRTAKAVNPISRTLRVEVDIPNHDHVLVPGMYLKVAFSIKGRSQIEVPAAALLFRSGGPQVAVIGDDGAVAFKDVTIASDNGNEVVIGSGLEAGDKVALNLSSQIAAGDKVKTAASDVKSASAQ
jgi:RND family efflux transporter MFP subunit